MKRILAILLTAAMLFISGCSNAEPLTKQEYFDEITKRVYIRNAAVTEICFSLYEYETNDIPLDKDEIRTKAQNAENALVEIKSLTPPSEYSGYHADMCDGVNSALPWFDALDDAIEADNKAAFSNASDRMNEISDKSTLLSAWYDYVVAVSDEVDMNTDRFTDN